MLNYFHQLQRWKGGGARLSIHIIYYTIYYRNARLLTVINNEVRLITSVSIVLLTIVTRFNDKRRGKGSPGGPTTKQEKLVISSEKQISYNIRLAILRRGLFLFCFVSRFPLAT